MATPIAVTNQKGGVGKTTTTFHTAGALSQAGAEVLVVDTDPQAHLTETAGMADEYELDQPNLYDVLMDGHPLEDIIVETHTEFDFVPSHVDMLNAEADLLQTRRRETRLEQALDDMAVEYDYVLIDTPPNLGVVLDNVLVASEHLVIPASAKTSSIRAMEMLFDELDAIDDAFGMTHEPIAVVLNEVMRDGETDAMRDWFADALPDVPLYEVRKRVALQRAENASQTIMTYSEDCDMEQEYERIADQIIEVTA